MKYIMDAPGLRETELVHHWQYLLNDLKRSESSGHKLARCFQMEVLGIQPDLIAYFELFIGESRLSLDHCFLRPLMRNYCLISICCQLLESFLCEAWGVGHVRGVSGGFIAVEKVERRLTMGTMNSGIVSKLRIC